ncbi:MAG: hypothetical protein AAGI23_12895 [Bacteroidota bacterium]
MKGLFGILLIVLLASCSANEETVAETATQLTRQDLIGTWEQTSLTVTYNQTLGIDDSITVFAVDEANWLRVLSVPPVRTIFQGDSTFQHIFRDINEEVTDRQRGLWNLIGDTLILITPDATYTYDITVQDNGTSRFESILDWDGDGAEDDGFAATHRLISRRTGEM